jgi:hypothetical protein
VKTSLTTVEEILKQLAKVVDGLTGILEGEQDGAQIENRVGSLLLSSHFDIRESGVRDKVGKQSTFGIDSKMLWDKYHFINSFAEYQGEHNQF